jgi:hypothetical protein
MNGTDLCSTCNRNRYPCHCPNAALKPSQRDPKTGVMTCPHGFIEAMPYKLEPRTPERIVRDFNRRLVA